MGPYESRPWAGSALTASLLATEWQFCTGWKRVRDNITAVQFTSVSLLAPGAHRLAGLVIVWLAQLNSTVQEELVWFCGEAEHFKVEMNGRTLPIGTGLLLVIEWNRGVLCAPARSKEVVRERRKGQKNNKFSCSCCTAERDAFSPILNQNMVWPICVIRVVVLCRPTLAHKHTKEVGWLSYHHLHIYLCVIFRRNKNEPTNKHLVQAITRWPTFCRSSITGELTIALVYVSSV